MTRVLAALGAVVAALGFVPAALAATFVVNDNGDAADPQTVTDPNCDTDADATNGLQCTLRAAIMQSNATAGADRITFTTGGQSPAPAVPLPAVTDQLTIDGGGSTTVTFAPTAAGSLLDFQAASSAAKALAVTGGGGGAAVDLGASGDRLDAVTVHDVAGTGIVVRRSNATVASPEVSGAAGDGITVSGNGVSISGGHVHNNGGNGVGITGQGDVVDHVVLYGNAGKPIASAGGVTPPQNLHVGPRRADGSLPLTGTSAAGAIELWSGDPSSVTAPAFLGSFSSPGDFTYNFASDPTPGSVVAAQVMAGGSSSSEFATVAVPADTASPNAAFARALDTNNVRVDFDEPLDPNSVQKEDFRLFMAGLERPISSATVSPDGLYVILTSSGWKAGEAGYVEFTSVGAVTDQSGNAMLTAPRLRVAAAPGDFIAPLGGRLSVSPKTMCLTHGRGCRKTGMTIKFVTSEAGKATLLIKRSDVTIGTRRYSNIVPGLNKLKFNGRLGSRKLRAGRYRLLIYVQDAVGNITDQPPIVLFKVKRVTR